MSAHFRIICTCQTPQDHLHMSITSGSSAHVDHLRIICTCQTSQDYLHMSNTSRSSAHVDHIRIVCTCRSPQDRLHMSKISRLSAQAKHSFIAHAMHRTQPIYTWISFQHRESVDQICACCCLSLSLLKKHQLKASLASTQIPLLAIHGAKPGIC